MVPGGQLCGPLSTLHWRKRSSGWHVQQIWVTVVVYKDYTLRVTSAGLSEQWNVREGHELLPLQWANESVPLGPILRGPLSIPLPSFRPEYFALALIFFQWAQTQLYVWFSVQDSHFLLKIGGVVLYLFCIDLYQCDNYRTIPLINPSYLLINWIQVAEQIVANLLSSSSIKSNIRKEAC